MSDGTSPSIDRCIHFGLIEILSSHFTKSIFTALISVSFRRLFRDQGRTAHQSIGRGGGRGGGKECAAAVSLRSDAMRAREGGTEGDWLPALRRAAATMSEREPQTRDHATSRASSCPRMTPIPIEHLNHVQVSPGSGRGRLRCRAAVLRPLPPNLSASFLHQLVGDESQSRGGHGAHSLTHLRTCTFRSIHSPGEGGRVHRRPPRSQSQSVCARR